MGASADSLLTAIWELGVEYTPIAAIFGMSAYLYLHGYPPTRALFTSMSSGARATSPTVARGRSEQDHILLANRRTVWGAISSQDQHKTGRSP